MKVAVILSATRESRVSERLALWVVNEVKKQADTTVELVDLADYPMPFFDEAISPRFNPNRQPKPMVQKWLKKINEQDAYIIVTPEYNHSITGALKNALDYIDWQVKQKPFAIVSHGSAGGARAAEHLKGIISEIRAIVIPTALAITFRVSEKFDENGVLDGELAANEYGPAATLKTVIQELKWYSDALTTARMTVNN